jgi:hypothetical protein
MVNIRTSKNIHGFSKKNKNLHNSVQKNRVKSGVTFLNHDAGGNSKAGKG